MKVIFFPEHLKLFFHANDKFIFQLIQLNLKLPSHFRMFISQIFSLMIGMFQHQVIDSISLPDLQLR